jgi:DNA ligase D-like protein (predicted 3'-phosphoesterase)
MPAKKPAHPIFVVQQHAATHLHYDFRLEIDRKLKSWVVPKGPSTNPKERRLAILTEDHALSYAFFEGTIEEGYGAGEVLLWDAGHYENLGDQSLKKSFKEGLIRVWLEGRKLKGGFALIKMKGRSKDWLLVKMADEEADTRRSIIRSRPESVKSRRTIGELKK